ncbi:hypothetical protein niasHS_005160 [Heterodera schachtii]|uniref:Uncharacterized protein n=1 Tax=Heterodera schachtii TaxID=97005 RepID=A0ABD2JRU5_HETSC
MDLILATDWINNAYPEMDLEDANKEKKESTKKQEEEAEDPSWISLIDEEMKREPLAPIGTPKKCGCAERRRPVPLVDHLCKRFKCSAHELHVLFKSIEKRRDIVEHLRSVQLRTAHLRPSVRNFPVRCNDLSILDTHSAPAYRGYLGITSITLDIHQLRVVNIVGVQTFPQRISVERLQNTLGGIYDPTIFPALRCKLLNGVTCLVYISGKIIVTGAQSLDILHQSFTNLSNIIPNYFRA